MSVRFADPPSVEGTVTVQLVLEELGVLEEPPTAALVVTLAA